MSQLQDVRLDRTYHPALHAPAFVTQAYGWGYEDGQAGEDRRGFMYFTLRDPRQAEYAAGYQDGLILGNPFFFAAQEAQTPCLP